MKLQLEVVAATVLMSISGYADQQTITIDGITWNYSANSGMATISGNASIAGDIVIPSSIGGCPVVGIGSSAFYSCPNLSSVEIPSGVTSIGDGAFMHCSAR